MAPAAVTVKLNGRNVDAALIKQAGDEGDDAGCVVVLDDEGWMVAGEVGLEAVDIADFHLAPARGAGDDFKMVTGRSGEPEQDGIGVGIGTEINRADGYAHACLLCVVEGFGDALIVDAHAKKAGDQCLVGTVSAAGSCEAAMEIEICCGDGLGHEAAGRFANPAGAGGMGTGWANHDGPDNIKEIHAFHLSKLCSRFRYNSIIASDKEDRNAESKHHHACI